MLETFGWDIVYATTLAAFDEALQASGKVPTGFAIDGASGQWASWHLVPGAPSNHQLVACVIASGTATVDGASVDLAGTAVTALITLGLDASGTIGPVGAPVIDTYTLPHTIPQTQYYAVVTLLGAVLDADIPKIAGAFGGIDLQTNPAGIPSWLTPNAAAFASTPLDAGDARGAVFAILAATGSGTGDQLQRAVDARLFDGAPAGVDRVVAIGSQQVSSQFVLPGLSGVVQGSSVSDFTLSPTGTAYNAGVITWGQFSYTNPDGSASTIAPTIPQGNAQLTLNGNMLHLSFSSVHFPYPGWAGPGNIMVAFDAEQFVALDIGVRSDGQLVIASGDNPQQSFKVTVIPDHDVQVFQICVNAALQVLFAVIGGALVSALGEAEEAATSSVSEEDGVTSSDFEMEEITSLVDSNASPEEIEEAEEEAGTDAGNALAQADDPGLVQKFKSALMANRYKIILKIIEKAVTKVGENLTAIGVALAKQDYDKLPAINPLIDDAAVSVRWADGSAISYVGGQVDGAIVFWATPAKPASD